MPTVSSAARVTARDGAVWRECVGCGLIAPLAPDVDHCKYCTAAQVRDGAVDALLGMATLHARGAEGAAADFDRMARFYRRLASGPGFTADRAAEQYAFAADMAEAARRLRTEHSTNDGGPA